MSLLLDALKHAEKNRVDKTGIQVENSTNGLELSPLAELNRPKEAEGSVADTQAMLRQRFDLTDTTKMASNRIVFAPFLRQLLLIVAVFIGFVGLLRWVLTHYFPQPTPLVTQTSASIYPPAPVASAPAGTDEANLPTIAPELAGLNLPFSNPAATTMLASVPVAVLSPVITVSNTPADQSIKKATFLHLSDLAPLPAPINDIRLQLDIPSATDKKLQAALQAAYAAYQQGKLNEAIGLYSNILKDQPDERDALLGLAMLRYQTNEFDKSRQYYQQVLSKYPKDEAAQAGLLLMQQDVSLSSLRAAVQSQPLSPQAAAGLAAWYAQQANWAEAQEWYFQAYQLQPQQADYAYHLAVSLDHLQIKAAAQRYYQEALQLAAQAQVFSFSPDLVQQRLQFLAQEN